MTMSGYQLTIINKQYVQKHNEPAVCDVAKRQNVLANSDKENGPAACSIADGENGPAVGAIEERENGVAAYSYAEGANGPAVGVITEGERGQQLVQSHGEKLGR
ncbi:hypothetical protein AMTR_s00001p00273030 [Amborella trichopoda]|uniref:Uncharacterized protein n=1 Tax=Amborella trichopoda TaxID=13333 RepID=W1NN43_AMBTC|nr:hypothetical protein AMTR_s00001p00273030 [Amborella trichopoda]